MEIFSTPIRIEYFSFSIYQKSLYEILTNKKCDQGTPRKRFLQWVPLKVWSYLVPYSRVPSRDSLLDLPVGKYYVDWSKY